MPINRQLSHFPMKTIIGLIVVIILVGFGISTNTTNVQAPAGYAAYVVERPITGSTHFQSVILGPGSTGLSWRLYGDLVSVTPYSYSETFADDSALITRDKLPLKGNAHVVWRIRGTTEQIKVYMEQFGGLDNARNADETAKESYDNYIKEPFRTLVREEFTKYDGLAVPDHIADMGQSIFKELSARLATTPFEIIQVVIGNAQPPPLVLEQISRKVAAAQELERKATELEIANRSKEIEKANGEAAGERELALAQKRAEANRALASSLTPELLQYLAIDNLKSAEKVYLQLGPTGLPLVGNVVDITPTPQPAKPPAPTGR